MVSINRGVFQDAAIAAARRPRFAALLLDGYGTIVKSSRAAAAMFSARPLMLEYTAIRSRIAELPFSHTSPSYNARQMAYLSNDRRWHRFQGVDVVGRTLTVELSVSRTNAEAQPLFLVKLRMPASA